MLSDVVAEQVAQLRKLSGLTREQVAARCADLGRPALTFGVLGSIETGRPDANGQRRREVTVDELVVLAKVLGVPPVLLVCPVGHVRSIEVLPGVDISPWPAAQWFTGEAPWPGGDESEVWRRGAVPLALHRWHANYAQQWNLSDDAEGRRILEAALALNRRDMRRHGITPPVLTENLRHVDELDEAAAGAQLMRGL